MSESSRSIKPHVASPRPCMPGVSSIISGGLRREVESIEALHVANYWLGLNTRSLDNVRRTVEAFSREALQIIAMKQRDHDAVEDMLKNAVETGHRTTKDTLTRAQILVVKRLGIVSKRCCDRALKGDERAASRIAYFFEYHEGRIEKTEPLKGR